MSNSIELIDLLAEKRREKEISTYRIGKKTKISHTTIARMEKHEVNISLDIFVKIAEEIGYDIVLVKREESNTSVCVKDKPKALKRTIFKK